MINKMCDEIIEQMKMYAKKVQEEAAEAKKASDLKLQEALEVAVKAEQRLERAMALPDPLEKLGWSAARPKHERSSIKSIF